MTTSSSRWKGLFAAGFAALALVSTSLAAEQADLRFSFGSPPGAGFTAVRASDQYNVNRGYGFDLGSSVVLDKGGFVTGSAQRPFFFSAKIDPGEYRVTVTLGDPVADTAATVKSETRRLMLEDVRVPAGQTRDFTFLVHVRVPRIPGGGQVRMKPREDEPILYVQWDPADPKTLLPFLELDWDEKLTLEFSDRHPALRALRIQPAEQTTTVFLIGDSTMTDEMMEPVAAWGQMLPRWFAPPVVIANYAECGEMASSFISARRWEKLLSELRAGDYVLIEFGINDRNRVSPSQFKGDLTRLVDDTRKHAATPIFITPQNLRSGFFNSAGKGQQTLGAYPEAMREVARERGITLIDLNAASTILYESIGAKLLPKAFFDGTHHSDWGAYELAKCVTAGLIAADVPFAKHVVGDWKLFDPSHPDPVESFHLPADPQLDPARPGGPGSPAGCGPMAGVKSGWQFPGTGAAPPAKVRVFVLAGQSNMEGKGDGGKLTAEEHAALTQAQQHVLLAYNRNPIRPLDVWPAGGNKKRFGIDWSFGPELFFGLRLADAWPKEQILLIKRSLGNTSLSGAWNPDWNLEQATLMKEEKVQPLYADMVAYVHEVLSHYEPGSYELCGFIWVQGESDGAGAKRGGSPVAAEAYGDNLQKLIRRVRADFGAPALPVLLVNSGREAHLVAARERAAREIARVSLIRSSSDHSAPDFYPGYPVGHYNYEGQKRIGSFLAAAYLKDYASSVVPVAPQ